MKPGIVKLTIRGCQRNFSIVFISSGCEDCCEEKSYFLFQWSLAKTGKIPVTFSTLIFLFDCIILKANAFFFWQVLTPPSAAADQSIANDSSPASLGVILGVTFGIILFVLLVATLIYRKHNAR